MRRLILPLIATLAVSAATVAIVASASGKGSAHHSLELRKTSLGRVIVDAKGRTLYRFLHDHGTRSTCSGACAAAWPPALVKGKPTVGKGLAKRKVGTTRRADGTRQLTYRGHPLYRFAGDANQPGKVTGQGINAFGGRWWVVDAKGRSVTKSAAAATATRAPMPTDGSGY
jgi:predicted lipoprotein with Yx(FWY)xxD motif